MRPFEEGNIHIYNHSWFPCMFWGDLMILGVLGPKTWVFLGPNGLNGMILQENPPPWRIIPRLRHQVESSNLSTWILFFGGKDVLGVNSHVLFTTSLKLNPCILMMFLRKDVKKAFRIFSGIGECSHRNLTSMQGFSIKFLFKMGLFNPKKQAPSISNMFPSIPTPK